MKSTRHPTSVRWISSLLGLLGAGLLVGHAQPTRATDGAKETPAPARSKLSDATVTFSRPHGFFTESFELVLRSKSPGVTLRYTTDGSAPGERHGTVYTKPLRIDSTSVIRAVATDASGRAGPVLTQTYLFLNDVVVQSPDGLPPAGFPIAWGENRVDYGMDPRVVNDPAYRDRVVPALRSLPSYSLVMDMKDLFEPPRGIYANSQLEGREAERPASLELIDRNGKGFQINCGVRIRGGFSSMSFNPKHAFRLFFRKEYGPAKLKFPVFGAGGATEYDSFDLRCSQNYSWSLGGDARGLFLRDQFNRDLQLAMGQPAARGDFCHLYLNGQYWGLYDTCERPEASFAASHLGGAKEDYDVIKTSGLGGNGGMRFEVAATDGTLDSWKRLHETARKGLASNERYFALQGRNPDGTPNTDLETLLDPTNLIDYMLIIFYGGNLDAPVTRFSGNRAPNNWHGLRSRKNRDGFKFFIWDAEHTLLEVDEDRTGPFDAGGEDPAQSHPQWLWQQCLENAEFRQLVADRIERHFGPGGVLSAPGARALLEKRVREIEEAVVAESARWGDAGAGGFGPPGPPRRMIRDADGTETPAPMTRDGEWRAEVRRVLDDFISKRSEIVRFQLWRHGLIPDIPAATASPAPGRVPAGTDVALSAADGEVLYTTDGTDPRRVGGQAGVSARVAQGAIKVSSYTRILARVRKKGEWGPLTDARYTVQ